MNLIRLADRVIHSVPILPGRLQDTWADRFWKRIERLVVRKEDER